MSADQPSPDSGSTTTGDSATTGKSAWSRVKKFCTGLPRWIRPLAAIPPLVAAILAIIVFFQSGSRNTAEPPGSPTKTASVAPSPGHTSAAQSLTSPSAGPYPGFRRLWGPADLVIAQDTDISLVPPQSDSTFGVVDLVDGDGGIISAGGTDLALWPGSSAPTPSQCETTADTQATGQTVTPYPGGTMCAVTSNDFVVIMQVIAVNASTTSTLTRTSIWSPVS
jgi:hypothetical protein